MGGGEARSRFSRSLGQLAGQGLLGQTVLLTLTNCLSHVCPESQGRLESVEGYLNSAFPPGT